MRGARPASGAAPCTPADRGAQFWLNSPLARRSLCPPFLTPPPAGRVHPGGGAGEDPEQAGGWADQQAEEGEGGGRGAACLLSSIAPALPARWGAAPSNHRPSTNAPSQLHSPDPAPQVIEELSKGIVNKLLHGPMTALRCDGADADTVAEVRAAAGARGGVPRAGVWLVCMPPRDAALTGKKGQMRAAAGRPAPAPHANLPPSHLPSLPPPYLQFADAGQHGGTGAHVWAERGRGHEPRPGAKGQGSVGGGQAVGPPRPTRRPAARFPPGGREE